MVHVPPDEHERIIRYTAILTIDLTGRLAFQENQGHSKNAFAKTASKY